MNIQSFSNFSQRLIIGSLSTFVMFSAIYLSFDPQFRYFFLLLIIGSICMALWEFYAIAKAVQYSPLDRFAIALSALYLFMHYFNTQTLHPVPHLGELTLLVALVVGFISFFLKGKQPLINLAVTLFGIAYLTFSLGFLFRINYLFPENSYQDGRLWLIYLLLVTKMMDVGAYFSGKALGKTKITPYISPSKTLEGTIGGLLSSICTSVLICWILQRFFSISMLSFSTSLWLGALLGAVAQFGDLAESLLKREGNIKDSNQLPGLGGVLDVMDSLVFTAPLLYFFLQYNL